jgi:TRAP-type C4-dicarboxylate transport system substrate-binding protein
VRAALQTGLIDTVTISPVGALALQWHTQVNYLTNIPLLYVYGMLAVDRKEFLKFSPQNQTTLRDIMGKAFRRIDQQNRVDNDKALEALKRQGIQFILPSMEALNRWRTTASDVSERLIRSGKLSKGIIDVLKGHLSDFRSKNLSDR